MWSRTASEKLISHLSYRIYEDPVLVQSSIPSPTPSLRVGCVTCIINQANSTRLGVRIETRVNFPVVPRS
jgi:hypothetical protein